MKEKLNPVAAFDCLFIASRLQQQNGNFSVPELHIFGYLACLLWLYRELPVADWNYEFVGTEYGAPYSRDIDVAADEFLQNGLFHRSKERLEVTESALRNLQTYEELSLNSERIEYLHAACSIATALSVGMVYTALTNEPELKRANAVPQNRLLLEESAQSHLYSHFLVLHKVFSERSNDLRLPAVTWVTALYHSEPSRPAV